MADLGATATTGLRDVVNVCQLCGALENLSLCGGCKGTWYCSKDHQRQDWKIHRNACKKGKKAPPTIGSSTVVKKGEGSDSQSTTNMPTECKEEHTSDLVSVDDNVTEPDSPTRSVADESNRSSPTPLKEAGEITTSSVLSSSTDHARISDKGLATHLTDPSVTGAREENGVSISHQSENGERDSLQVREVSVPVLPTAGIERRKSSKKRLKNQQSGVLAAISEDGSPPERYYLNSSTHRISLPPLARSAVSNQSGTSTMGMGENSLSPAQSREQYLSVLQSRFDELAKYAVKCLTRFGICVIDKFLGDMTGQEILKEVQQLQTAGIMKQGQLVHGPSASSNKYIRGDMITWVDGTEPRSENIHFLISCMDAVLLQCASQLDAYTINERTKAMVACYPGRKTRYVRHVDNPNGDGRCITCIYYLNKDWDVRIHGGLLRIYPEGEDRVANVEPIFDRLIFFWSDRRNPHEVEESFRERFAITVWYYDAEERAQALKRFKGSNKSSSMKSQAVSLFNDHQT